MEQRIKNLEDRVQHLENNNNDVNTIVAVISNKLDNIIKSLDKLSLQHDKNISDEDIETLVNAFKDMNEKGVL